MQRSAVFDVPHVGEHVVVQDKGFRAELGRRNIVCQLPVGEVATLLHHRHGGLAIRTLLL